MALHLTSPSVGYGTDVVGYLAGLAAVSIIATPRWGRLADRVGPRRLRLVFAAIQMIGMITLLPFGNNVWLLIIPLLCTNIVGPAIDVTSRMTFLSLEPDQRTRFATIYTVMMFIGGSVGSALGTRVFAAAGWTGTALYVLVSSLTLTLLSALAFRLYGKDEIATSASADHGTPGPTPS